METIELDDFYNAGFGWICRHCERELHERKKNDSSTTAAAADRSRLLTEGEAESKQPRLSSEALAKWQDAARTTLICPRCGIAERADKF